MIRALWNSRSGMQAMQNKLDGISNNVANVQTVGYKKVDVSFNDLVYEQLERNGYPTNKNGVNQHLAGSGVKANEWLRDNTQGPMNPTGIDTDLAIDGKGFFKVTRTDGTSAYTRAGSFNLDRNGDLVTSSGERVEINYTGNVKKLTKNNFTIAENGDIATKGNDGTSKIIGKINLYEPVGQDAMISVGNNLYVPKTGIQVNQVTDSGIMQKYTEGSNTDLATEMTDMIVAQRAFELNSKSLTTVDQMMGIINNLRNR